jgi:hypothetical protein
MLRISKRFAEGRSWQRRGHAMAYVYVAVASGMKNEIMKTESGPATVVIYSLP